MNESLYLLVCEGPTDILVINEIAKKISNQTNKHIIIRELSPQLDATTNRYPNHGWKEVRQWCKLYGKSLDTSANSFEALAARNKNWKPILEISGASGLIIQVDTDIIEHINDITPFYSGTTKNARKRFLEKAILKWLGEDSLPNELFLVKTTYSTETWLLATHDKTEDIFNDLGNNFDFEDINNVIDRLITLNYLNYIDPTNGNRKISKDLETYQNYADKIADNLNKVRIECDEVEKLCIKLET